MIHTVFQDMKIMTTQCCMKSRGSILFENEYSRQSCKENTYANSCCPQVVHASLQAGAAGPVRQLVSTVVEVTDGTSHMAMARCLQRSQHRHTETPQAFLYDTIVQAYQQ